MAKKCLKKPIAAMILIISMSVGLLCGCGTKENTADEEIFVSEENKLIIYTSHKEEVYGPIVKEFEERTGIWVEVKTGGTIELLEQLAGESGQGTCDVMFGGGVESYEVYKEYFEAYQCDESSLLDETYRSSDNSWTVFSELPIVFIYNKKLVTSEEAPKGWADLLQPEWEGKIAFADPGNSGVSCTALLTMCQVLDMEPEQLTEAFAQELNGTVSASSKSIISEVSAGTKIIGITLEETALKAINQGADITMVYPQEGTSVVPDGVALVKDAPHAQNAKLFIDFAVGKDVQTLLGDQLCRRTVRMDIRKEEDWESIDIVDFDLEWASEHQAEILELWEQAMEQENQK